MPADGSESVAEEERQEEQPDSGAEKPVVDGRNQSFVDTNGIELIRMRTQSPEVMRTATACTPTCSAELCQASVASACWLAA